jgi:hypothetical protein
MINEILSSNCKECGQTCNGFSCRRLDARVRLKRRKTISSLPRAFLHSNFSKDREDTEAKHTGCQEFTRRLGRRLYTPGLNKVTLDLRLGLEKSGPCMEALRRMVFRDRIENFPSES